MNRITLFFILVFLNFSSFSQPIIEVYFNIQTYIKKNTPVESIEEKYELLIKELPSQPLRVTLSFNREGNLVNEKKFGKKDGLLSETSWEYNKDQHLTRKTHKYFVNMLGWRLEETLLNYNDSGCLTDIRFSKDGLLLNSATVKCDADKRPEELQVFDGKGVHLTNEKVKYIPSANVIKVMVYKYTNQFVGNFNYPYDNSQPFQNSNLKQEFYPNGNVMLEFLGSTDGSNQGYFYEYKYDGYGNWVEKETFQVTLGKNNKIKSKKAEHKITRAIKYY